MSTLNFSLLIYKLIESIVRKFFLNFMAGFYCYFKLTAF